MSIQINPYPPLPAGIPATQAQQAAPLVSMTMAPAHLTPLIPPVGVQGPRPAPMTTDASIAADGRQAYFAECRKTLMDRLAQDATAPDRPKGGALSEAQRSACISVLTTVAAAVSST